MSLPIDQLCAALDEQIRKLESLPNGEVREQVFAVLQMVDQLHRGGIQKIAEAFRDDPVWPDLCQEPAVNVLMKLYGETELDDREQVEQTLDMVRPYIESHGGQLDLVKVEGGQVHVRLDGACEICSGAEATIKNGVEEALRAGYPDFRQLIIENITGQATLNLVQLRVNAPVFEDILRLEELPDAQLTATNAAGRTVMLVRSASEITCFDTKCHSCGGSFVRGQVRGHIVMCERSNCAYDFRTGRQVDGGNAALRVYPLRVRDRVIAVATNVEPAVLSSQS